MSSTRPAIVPMDNTVPMHPVEIWKKLKSLRDPRTADWATVSDPKYVIIILVLYLYITKIAGPRYMAHREPYDLRRTIQLYNIFQAVVNVYFCSRIFYLAFVKSGYSFYCQGVTYSPDYYSLQLLNNMYGYLIIRIIDLLETIFFVLRKKFGQVSQLHVIHHTITVFSGWVFLNFGADGQTILGVCLNAMVHVIMYSYYFLTTLGPGMRKYLWWKSYLTRVQIIQFLVMITHGSIPWFIDCGYPRILTVLGIPVVVLMLGLFLNFYLQTYIRKKQRTPHSTDHPSLENEADNKSQ